MSKIIFSGIRMFVFLGICSVLLQVIPCHSFEAKDAKKDQYDRVVQEQNGEKINYLWKSDEADKARIGNSKAKTVFFTTLTPPMVEKTASSIPHSPVFRDSDITFKEKWMYGILGSGIGKSGIITADIDSDGTVEIVLGGSTSTFGSNNFWYVLEASEPTEYKMKWISPFYEEGISTIAAFDIDGDGILHIFLALSNGSIEIYDGSSFNKIDLLSEVGTSINEMLFADADNDSNRELVFCDENNILIYDADSFLQEVQIPYGANDCKVGNVDEDPANEIVLSSGIVIELDETDYEIEWEYLQGNFGYKIELSDIDSDNMEEIIGASSWYYVTAFDADIHSPKWQIPTDLDVDALLVRDVDGDGVDEVLYGDGQWGEIHCYDAVSLAEKWNIHNPEHGATNIAVFDTNGDGNLEILWGAGASSTGEDHLYVHDISTLALQWQSSHIDGPFHAVDVGDVDSDGTQELVFASFASNSTYSDGTLFIYDAETFELQWQSETDMFGSNAWTGIHDLKIGDVDDDEDMEIIVATDRLYDGTLYIINGKTHEIEHNYLYDEGSPLYSLDIYDVDNDGETEIIAGGGREHTGSPGTYVYVINGSTGEVEWQSVNLSGYWSGVYAVKAGDVNNDSIADIVAVNDNVYVFDGVTHQQWISSLTGCRGLALHDTDGDSVKEILVGTEDGHIAALYIDGLDIKEKLNISVSSSSVDGLQAYDLDQDGEVEIVFSSSGQLHIYSLTQSTVLWQSSVLGLSAGSQNSLVVSDLDSDERAEFVTGTNYTVNVFSSSAPGYSLSVKMAGTGTGLVTSEGQFGFNCSTDCSQTYEQITVVTLTAAPDEGSTFEGWSGDCSGQELSCTVTVDGNKNVTAIYESIQTEAYPLNIEKSGPGYGIVESDYGGIACGYNCTQYYEPGAVVTLTAIPKKDVTIEWSGCNSIKENNCTVIMNSAKTVYTVFKVKDSVSPLNGTIGTELNIITTIDNNLYLNKVNIGTKKCRITRHSSSVPQPPENLKVLRVTCTITKKMIPENSYPVTLFFMDGSYKTFDQLFTVKSPEIDSVELISKDIRPIELMISGTYFGNGKVKVRAHFEKNGKRKNKKCRITSHSTDKSGKTTIKCKAHKKVSVDNIIGITVKNKVGRTSFPFSL